MNRAKRTPWAYVRWLVASACVIVLVVGWALDEALVRTDTAGYCPPDSAWTLHAANAGVFWDHLEATDVYRTLETYHPQPIQAFEREVYWRTGIRPTGWRWRLWMGRSLLVSGNDTGWGICVHPGVLLRIVGLVSTPFTTTEEGLHRFGDLYYGWRNGFLVFSPSNDIVQASLSGDPTQEFETAREDSEIALSLLAAPDAVIRLKAEDGWPVSGSIAAPLRGHTGERIESDSSRKLAGLSIHGGSVRDIASLWDAVRVHLPETKALTPVTERVRTALSDWTLPDLPPRWDDDTQGVSLMLCTVTFDGVFPTAGVAAEWQGNGVASHHPLTPWTTSGEVAHEWSDEPGSVTPILGNAYALCLARRDTYWMATSNEPLMAALLETSGDGEVLPGDLAFRLKHSVMADWFREGMERIGSAGLFRGIGRDDLRAAYGSWIEAWKHMGETSLTGTADGSRVTFDGYLAEGVEAADATK